MIRFADNFEDGVPDRNIWGQSGFVTGTGATVQEQNGRLEMAFAPDALAAGDNFKMIAGQYGTQCRFLGDFDVRVDFELLDWPSANGVLIQLAAWFRASNLSIARQSQAWGENYTAWHRSSGNTAETHHLRGGLRIRRVNDSATTYFRRGNAWVPLRTFSTDQAPIIGLQAMTTDEWFADKPVLIAFDNFEMKAEQPVC